MGLVKRPTISHESCTLFLDFPGSSRLMVDRGPCQVPGRHPDGGRCEDQQVRHRLCLVFPLPLQLRQWNHLFPADFQRRGVRPGGEGAERGGGAEGKGALPRPPRINIPAWCFVLAPCAGCSVGAQFAKKKEEMALKLEAERRASGAGGGSGDAAAVPPAAAGEGEPALDLAAADRRIEDVDEVEPAAAEAEPEAEPGPPRGVAGGGAGVAPVRGLGKMSGADRCVSPPPELQISTPAHTTHPGLVC